MWVSQTNERVYGIDYHSILLHAISRDESAFPHPCVYCQITGDVPSHVVPPSLSVVGQSIPAPAGDSDAEDAADDDTDTSEESEDEEKMVEMRFVPKQDGFTCMYFRRKFATNCLVSAIFDAMAECSAMNPDEGQDSDAEMISEEDLRQREV